MSTWAQLIDVIVQIGNDMLDTVELLYKLFTANLSDILGVNEVIWFVNETVLAPFDISIDYEVFTLLTFMLGPAVTIYIGVMIIKWIIGVVT